MFNAISQTVTDFDNGRFSGFKNVSVLNFIDNDLPPAALISPAVFI